MEHTKEEIQQVIRFRDKPHSDSLRLIATHRNMNIDKVKDILRLHAPHLVSLRTNRESFKSSYKNLQSPPLPSKELV